MKKSYILLSVISATLLLAACGPNQAEVAAMVEAQVAEAAAGTIEAMPTATAQPTLTANPTLTPPPTLAPAATRTPAPTLTPRPTYTPYPTPTPLPTETATTTPTPRPTVVAQGSPSGTGSTSGFNAAFIVYTENLMYEIAAALEPSFTAFNNIASSIDYTVDCQAFITAYDQFVTSLAPPVTTADPQIQSAYSLYQTAVGIFSNAVMGWVDGCREAVVTGETKEISNQAWQLISAERIRAYDLLQQARGLLE
ncbi:MAG: hypothetical protein AB1791_17685 [Chloroflexota bacterium]